MFIFIKLHCCGVLLFTMTIIDHQYFLSPGFAASAIRTASSEPEEVHQVRNEACV